MSPKVHAIEAHHSLPKSGCCDFMRLALTSKFLEKARNTQDTPENKFSCNLKQKIITHHSTLCLTFWQSFR